MAYYKAIEGFEFHEKVTAGVFDYFIFVNKQGQTLIRRIQISNDSTRFCLTTDSLAVVTADPTVYSFYVINHWKL